MTSFYDLYLNIDVRKGRREYHYTLTSVISQAVPKPKSRESGKVQSGGCSLSKGQSHPGMQCENLASSSAPVSLPECVSPHLLLSECAVVVLRFRRPHLQHLKPCTHYNDICLGESCSLHLDISRSKLKSLNRNCAACSPIHPPPAFVLTLPTIMAS
jgi:hypothetical protein